MIEQIQQVLLLAFIVTWMVMYLFHDKKMNRTVELIIPTIFVVSGLMCFAVTIYKMWV